jgi:hypothetical protein
MRDLAEKWPAPPEWPMATISEDGLDIRAPAGLNQFLVSGDLSAWAKVSGIVGEGVGAGMIANGAKYTVRVARDRVLAVSSRSLSIQTGWHDAGFAVTAMNAGLLIFEIGGAGLDEMLARATTLDPQKTSASASVLFAGINVLLYRFETDARARIHVDRSLAPYLWEWLEQSSWL